MSCDWPALLLNRTSPSSGWSVSFVQQRSRTDMENNTSAPVCEQPYDADMGLAVGKTVGLSLASGVALFSNLLVLIVFKRNPSTRTNINVLIVNMAASDLLLPIFGLPLNLVPFLLGTGRFLIGGPVGEVLCKLVPFMAYISGSVSIQSLVLIAVERFIAVVYPLKTVQFSPRRRTSLVIVTWVVAAVSHSPILYFRRLRTTCGETYCVRDWSPLFDTRSAHPIYFAVTVNLHMALCLLVIACLYTAILIKLRRTKVVPGNCSSQTDPQSSRRRERNKNITNMSVCIVLAFALCYLPTYFFVMLLLSPNPPSSTVHFVTLNLVYANGAVNPWILFYFCSNFRRGLRDMFGCNACLCRTSNRVAAQNIELQIVHANAPDNWNHEIRLCEH